MPNQYINKVQLSNGTTLIDLTGDTITIGDAVVGVSLHLASGEVVTGALDDFTGATASTAGTHGLVPAPASGEQNYVLTGTGDWASSDVFVTPSASANSLTVKVGHYQQTVAFDAADTTNAGVMSAADKTRLNNVNIGMKLLWTNPNPTSAMSAGTTSNIEGLSGYDLYMVIYKFDKDTAQYLSQWGLPGEQIYLPLTGSTTNRAGSRTITINSNNSFTVINGGYNGSASSNHEIPYKIYGITLL